MESSTLDLRAINSTSLYLPSDVWGLFRVSPATFDNWVRLGKLSVVKIGRVRRVLGREVLRLAGEDEPAR
jgi:hypothetical protein